MAGEWVWRAFGGQSETVKKGVFLTLQALAAGMVWFYGRGRKAGSAKKRRRSVSSRGKSDCEEFETPVSSPGKSASARWVNPFKTPIQTPVKPFAKNLIKTPVKSAAKSTAKSAMKSAVKSAVSSLLLTPVASLSASLSGFKGSDWKQEGPVRRLFQQEDEEENEDWWEEEAKGGRREPRYEVDSEDALSASDEEIRRILDDE